MTGDSLAALWGIPAAALAGGALAGYLARGARKEVSVARVEEIPPAGPEPSPDADLAFHRLVADNVSDVLMRLDSQWVRVFVSPACLDVFGYRVHEVLARPAFELVHPDDRDGLRRVLGALGSACPLREHAWRGMHRDGRTVWIEGRYRYIPEDGGAVAILRDITGRRLAEERLRDAMDRIERLPMADPTTGLPNEQVFRATLAGLLTDDPCLAVLRIAQEHDLTGMAPEPAEAAIAREVARRLSGELVRQPIVAGLGSAGFAVAIRCGDGDQGAAACARDLLRVLGEPNRIQGQHTNSATFIGIAAAPRDAATAAGLIDAANLALERARDAGPGTYRFYEAAMGAAAARQRDLRAALPAAIAAGRIVPWYQPIVRLNGGEVWGFEVLARWLHPELGLLEPAEFVPLAEEIGATGALLRAMLRGACAAAGPGESGLSFNLSAFDVQDAALPGDLATILDATGFDGTRLEMEIREEGYNLNSRPARAAMDGLRLLGVSLALDDLGTGHSDLSLLRELPLDKVKIDGALVRPLARGSENNRFFRAVVQLSHAMGLEVVAKGIEAAATLDAARVLGCTYGQGDWIRPPGPVLDLSPAPLGSRD